MELEKVIAQLLMIGFQGQHLVPHHPLIADITERNLGGVILFDKSLATGTTENNIVGATQLQTLCTDLQNLSSVPLLIAIDQEGGRVRRLKPETGFPETASAAYLGTRDDSTATALHAATNAQTLNRLGINYNLAPVVDLNTFPDNPVIGKIERSFSADPNCVIRHAAIWIREHRKYNIISCLKHFPGHGSSHSDSHLGFTDISKSWHPRELLPFHKLIHQDQAQPIESVMLGHLFHYDLDPIYPASLSQRVIHNLLRKQLGFKGLVITDDLQMKAITDTYGLEEAACLALAAGVDMLIIGNNLEYDPEVLQGIVAAVSRAVKERRIPERRIDEAWQRVRKIKEGLPRTINAVGPGPSVP